MADGVKERGASFAKFLSEMSPQDRDRANEANRKEAEAQHKQFSEAFKAGRCSFCGDSLTSFDESKPCQHWLLKPDGFSKGHFEVLSKKYSLTALENYARWAANEEAFAQNINDLADEGTGKLVELTVKYKNLAWSFSCGANDLSGHEGGGEQSKVPHYHFQMYVDDKPLIRYNDFHPPLSVEDIGIIEFMRAHGAKVRRRVAGGAGMGEVLNEATLEHALTMGRSGTSEEDVESAPISLDTFVVAETGKTIRGEDVYNLIQAAKEQGVTATSKLRKMQGVSVTTIVSAGPGVVRQATRSGRKRKGDRQVRDQDRAWREKNKRDS